MSEAPVITPLELLGGFITEVRLPSGNAVLARQSGVSGPLLLPVLTLLAQQPAPEYVIGTLRALYLQCKG